MSSLGKRNLNVSQSRTSHYLLLLIGCCIYSKPDRDGSDSEGDGSGGEWDDCCHEHKVGRSHIPNKTPPH